MTARPTLTSALLDWYDRHARALPWRIGPAEIARGVAPVPYRVWLSEIMLQQTTVRAAEPYFAAFTTAWPTVLDLAGADEADVLKAWAGLGYYSRARNLAACAREIAQSHGGEFPRTVVGLRALPGIGDYTAAAIGAIAFGTTAPVVDGNVERVMARIDAIEVPNPALKKRVRETLEPLVPEDRPGDFAQGLMDLGATVCTPRSPACAICPCREVCRATGDGPERLPVNPAKAKKPTRAGAAFALLDGKGRILLRQRPPKGLLGGMTEVPGSPWSEDFAAHDWPRHAPAKTRWAQAPDEVRHTFTHFHLVADVYWGIAPKDFRPPADCWWAEIEGLEDEALPTVMRKAVACGLAGARAGGALTSTGG